MTTPADMPTRYQPGDHESRIAERWARTGTFGVDPGRVLRGEAEPYCILIPPPNVTAALHLGHALNNTLQDVLARAHRMMGFETLWMPGTDHAGIATQTVVDRRMREAGEPALADYKAMEARGEHGREQFIAKVQAWKDEYEQRITDQLQAMGCSCDWERQRFTMDEVCVRAVREAFFRLFKDGLIYRGKRLVNWDPVSQTALADDEVEMREVQGSFYYLRYPLVHQRAGDDAMPVTWGELAARGYPRAGEMPDDEQAWVTVATTRPETYLGDTAVAVNPADPRAGPLRGLHAELPLVGRIIPIVEDDYVVMPALDPDAEGTDPKAKFATGFLKVTPAHDPNDYEIGQRHGLAIINVMAPDGSISADHGWSDYDPRSGARVFIGKRREEARKLVVQEFRDREVSGGHASLLEKVTPYTHSVGHSYRSHAPIEPYFTDQWYVKVTDDRLRGEAQRALVPEQRTEASLEAWPESLPTPATSGDHKEALPGQSTPAESPASTDATMTFHPARYAKTYEGWHDNLRDWCISRQLWWGHRIPVWSGTLPIGTEDWPWCDVAVRVFEGGSDSRACFVCVPPDRPEIEAELDRRGFAQDPDVLDTWFSSALWPLSTLGWPDGEAAARDTGIADFPDMLAAFNPTSSLLTAREIITLWVSRMVMFNRYFLGEARRHGGAGATSEGASGPPPFRDVFIHAMIQDGEGRKMSKSLGNGVDPLDIIHSHGADAMRFTLVHMTTQTQDVRMPVERDAETGRNTSPRFDLGRNFCNKLWNASRFVITMLREHAPGAPTPGMTSLRAVSREDLTLPDRWMLSRLARAIDACEEALRNYQFSSYAETIYTLLWRDYCDWYLEAVKPTLKESPAQQAVLRHALDAILRLLHPVCPFITEVIFEQLREIKLPDVNDFVLEPSRKGGLLCTVGWPWVAGQFVDSRAEESWTRAQELITAIREVRAQHRVAPRRQVALHVPGSAREAIAPIMASAEVVIRALAGAASIHDEKPTGPHVVFRVGENELMLSDLADALDEGAERERLSREIGEREKSVAALTTRLANPGYANKAPAHLVQQTRDQLVAAEAELAALRAQLGALG